MTGRDLRLERLFSHGKAVVVNMSGRGDKDLFITAPVFRPAEWKAFLERELAGLASRGPTESASPTPSSAGGGGFGPIGAKGAAR